MLSGARGLSGLVRGLERMRGAYSGKARREEWYEQADLY